MVSAILIFCSLPLTFLALEDLEVKWMSHHAAKHLSELSGTGVLVSAVLSYLHLQECTSALTRLLTGACTGPLMPNFRWLPLTAEKASVLDMGIL